MNKIYTGQEIEDCYKDKLNDTDFVLPNKEKVNSISLPYCEESGNLYGLDYFMRWFAFEPIVFGEYEGYDAVLVDISTESKNYNKVIKGWKYPTDVIAPIKSLEKDMSDEQTKYMNTELKSDLQTDPFSIMIIDFRLHELQKILDHALE
jgi:hypothetical protein